MDRNVVIGYSSYDEITNVMSSLKQLKLCCPKNDVKIFISFGWNDGYLKIT